MSNVARGQPAVGASFSVEDVIASTVEVAYAWVGIS